MKLAIIHDSIGQYGGAEKVLEEMHAAFPDAPIFMALWNQKGLPPHFRQWDVRTSWLDRLPGARRWHRALFPLYPMAMHGFDLSGFDVVLSSSFNFAHNVVVGPEAVHICYCHSPARFLWDFHGYAERERFGRLTRGAVSAMLPTLRTMDAVAAMRVDHWISTSRLVQQRIGKYYRRESEILPPPIRVAEFRMGQGPGEHFLLLMRLVGWKRADIAIEACNRLKLPLVVAGDGRDTARLRAMAGPTIRFAGRVDGAEKAALYARSTALILPAVEDFGITPLESMAAGRPVIALGAGGALDTVRPGVTGEFFPEQNAESLIETLSAFRPEHYDSEVIRAHAETFDAVAFRAQLRQIVAAHAPPAGSLKPPRPTARLPPAELAARPAG
ncbi:glycosyltransferase [Siccirubricoccus phaeus]|uniref:glycosyltransferase n=1 Tax=Siccirubricoccus phaeus TaxID=2595053 RepID=UPI0011F284BD|nr:glycosyltransferase [Siccirubricoccus phaeus]